MFKKSLICAAAAALVGMCGVTLAETTVYHSPTVDQDGIAKKKVILHDNGDRTVVKKKVKYDSSGNKVVKKKVVHHTASTTPNVTVVHRTTPSPVIVHRVERPATTTTVIRRDL